jgi:D-glycero-D-manno-heptose 1,7-bisphosphate phosphatase
VSQAVQPPRLARRDRHAPERKSAKVGVMSELSQQTRPAVFLDRDGTIIEDRGDLSQSSQVEVLPGVISALQRLQRHYALFIVTNQSGVGKGTLNQAQVDTVNAHLVGLLEKAGITIERVFVCPHVRSEGCLCIKPKPYFLRLAEREHGIDLGRSFTIGDHPHDVEFAHSVGATGLYVLTGHGTKHRADLGPTAVVFPSLVDAVDMLLASNRAPLGHAGTDAPKHHG